MIKTYSKTEYIDAYQFDGNIKELLDYFDTASASDVSIGIDGKITAIISDYIVREGDYVISNDDGYAIIPKDKFENVWSQNEPCACNNSTDIYKSFEDMLSSKYNKSYPWYTLMYCRK